MFKGLIIGCCVLALSACQAQDVNDYRLNPARLQAAIKQCPARSPANVSCAELMDAAKDVNRLAYELQMNPQGFGSKIIALQEALVQQQQRLMAQPRQTELALQIQAGQKQLAERLAIVRWLESP